MSGSSPWAPGWESPPTVPLRRLMTVAAFAVVGPFAVGIGIAQTQPGSHWRLEGLGPFLAICLVLVAFAAWVATLAGVEPVAVGTMSGLAFAIGSVVREGSAIGALIALAAGASGGVLAANRIPERIRPRHGLLALLLIAIVLGMPIGLMARVGPAAAASSFTGSPSLVSATPRGKLSAGYVLHGRPDRFLEGASLMRVVPQGLGSWAVDGLVELPKECQLPERIDGSDLQWFPVRHLPSSYSGVLIKSSEIERVCWLLGERVVVGIAPPGTRKIDASTIAGEEVGVPIGAGGAYIVLLEEDTIAATFVRISFRDGRGAMLDSKPLRGPGEYANLAYLSGLIPHGISPVPPPEHVVVSKYILTPEEFRRFCKEEPPHGDGFVAIAIVSRLDGTTREVVVGTGMPFSSGHPEPDPPLVRPSDGRPCFARS